MLILKQGFKNNQVEIINHTMFWGRDFKIKTCMNMSMMELSELVNKIPLCPKQKNTAKDIATQQ